MFRALRAHHQEVKIALHSLWYHHTETSEWSKVNKIHFYKYEHIVVNFHFYTVEENKIQSQTANYLH